MRRVAIVGGLILGAFFIVRAIVELITIDYSDPSSYSDDWGGPSLVGVLLVHCGLGVIAVIAFFLGWRRTRADGAPTRRQPPRRSRTSGSEAEEGWHDGRA